MQDHELKPSQSASEEVFGQFEESLTTGPVRDLWWNIREELAEGGPESVRTYLQSEYQRRYTIVENALKELSNQLEETI